LGQQARDILYHHQPRPELGDGGHHSGPQAGASSGRQTATAAREREVLAVTTSTRGAAARSTVVTSPRFGTPGKRAARTAAACGSFSARKGPGAEDFGEGEVETAVPGEHGAERELVGD
jgi:hypothetical protein